MKKSVILTLFFVFFIICVETKKSYKTSSSRGNRGSSRKTNSNPQPHPTSFSNPQSSGQKPSLFGWQEKPATRNTQTYSKQSNSQSHSYPSGQTALSGNTPVKQPPTYQESIHQQTAQRPATHVQTNNQPSHSYPSSNGLSGSSGAAGYPHGSGLSGSGSLGTHSSGGTYPHTNVASGTGVGYPQGISGAGGPPPYPGYKSGTYNNGASHLSHGAGNGYHPPQGPPPPYSNYGGYSGYGGHNNYNPGYGSQMPGYFGNYGNKGFGGVSRGSSALTGIGIAGAGVGTILTGLALWNLARTTGRNHHTVIYDNGGKPVAVAADNGTDPVVDSVLKDLVNCTLTISSENSTEVLAIPCAIATSFTPEADVKNVDEASSKVDNTKCTVTVVTTAGREFMTTIPCSILLNTAAENNVTEPPIFDKESENINASTLPDTNQPATAMKLSGDNETQKADVNCSSIHESGEVRDPLNPCLVVAHNLTVIPLDPTPNSLLTTEQ